MTTKHITEDQAIELFGYKGTRFSVLVEPETGFIRKQKIMFVKETAKFKIAVTLRFDDEFNNGHEDFSITGDTWSRWNGRWREDSGGCIHNEIAEHFPNLKHLIKWHLVSTDGPMHYVANVVYHMSNRDFEAARSVAVWSEATDEQLSLEKEELTKLLLERLPGLLAEFRKDMDSCGFIWRSGFDRT